MKTCWRDRKRSMAADLKSNYQAQGLKLSKHFK